MGQKDGNVVKSLASLGGGVASTGNMCGALLGGVICLGSLFGKESPDDKDDPNMWRTSHKFFKRFESEVADEWSSINCRDMTGVDWKNKEQAKNFYQGEGRKICADNTGKAALILGQVLEDLQQDQKKS